MARGGPLDEEHGLGDAGEILERGPAPVDHEGGRQAVRGRDEQEPGLLAGDQRRLKAVIDCRRRDRPGLVDDTDRDARLPVGATGAPGAAHHPHPLRAVGQPLDRGVVVVVHRRVTVGPGVGETELAVHDVAHLGHLNRHMQEALGRAEPLALVQPPREDEPQKPRLAELAGQRQDQHQPHQPAGGVDLEQAASDQALKPARLDAAVRPTPPLEFTTERVHRGGVRGGHEPRPDRPGGHVAQVVEPRHVPERRPELEPVRLGELLERLTGAADRLVRQVDRLAALARPAGRA